MKHRHVDLPDDYWNYETVESVFERGSDAEVWALLKAVRREPSGDAARATLQAVQNNRYYGWSSALPRLIHKWQKEQRA